MVKVISMTDEINELFTLHNGGHPHATRLLACRVFVSTLPFRGIGDGDGAPVNPTKATPPNLVATENPPPLSFQHHRFARDEAAHIFFGAAGMEYETKTRKSLRIGSIRMCWLLTSPQPPT